MVDYRYYVPVVAIFFTICTYAGCLNDNETDILIIGGYDMTLKIDGRQVDVKPGQSLLELVRQLGMDEPVLRGRPSNSRVCRHGVRSNSVF